MSFNDIGMIVDGALGCFTLEAELQHGSWGRRSRLFTKLACLLFERD
jgi:hypothetical protein